MFITNPGRMGDEDGMTFITKANNEYKIVLEDLAYLKDVNYIAIEIIGLKDITLPSLETLRIYKTDNKILTNDYAGQNGLKNANLYQEVVCEGFVKLYQSLLQLCGIKSYDIEFI